MKDIKHILIVSDYYHKHDKVANDLWIEQMVMSLTHTNRAKVTVVPNQEEMEKVINVEMVDTIIFTSGTSLMDARNLKGLFQGKKVVVATADFPENEIVILDKGWMENPLVAESIILN